MPVAPIAGFSPFQEQAFNQIQGMQGMSLPYFNQAANYLQNSAAPISGSDVQNYYNPFAQNVFSNLQDVFGQQMKQTTGNLQQQAGGIGADRIAVAQANLAKQQGLAAGQTAASLYQPALQAAQQQKQMEAGAGYGLGQLGPAEQQSYLLGTGALGQAGAQQQGLTQAQLNAQYQNQLAQIAYPFQTPQYLAGITGGLAPAFGGTTAGQATTTYPTPSPLSQILGVGTALAGLGTGLGGLGALGSLGGSAAGKGGTGGLFGGFSGYGGPTSQFGMGSGGLYGPGFRRGGYIINPFAQGGSTEYGDLASTQGTRSGNPYAHHIDLDKDDYADGGDVGDAKSYGMDEPFFDIPSRDYSKDPASLGEKAIATAKVIAEPYARVGRGAYRLAKEKLGYDDGGDVDTSIPSVPGASIPKAGSASPIPRISLPMGAGHSGLMSGQSIDLSPQKIQKPSFGGIGTDISKLISAVPKDAQGGPVNPFDTGMGFQSGGSTSDDDLVAMMPKDLGPMNTPARRPDSPYYHNSHGSLFFPGYDGERNRYLYGVVQNPDEQATGEPRYGLYYNPPGIRAHGGRIGFDDGGPAFGERFSGDQESDWPDINPNALGFGTKTAALKGMKEASLPQEEVADSPDDIADLSARERVPSPPQPTNPYVSANRDMRLEDYTANPNRPYPDATQRDAGQQLIRNPLSMFLMRAGRDIATRTGPIGSVIAGGIGAGADALEDQRKALLSEEDRNQKADALFARAKMHLDEYQRMTPEGQARLAESERAHREAEEDRKARMAMSSFPGVGMDPETGQQVPGIYQYNPATHQHEFKSGIIKTSTAASMLKPVPMRQETDAWGNKITIYGMPDGKGGVKEIPQKESETLSFKMKQDAAQEAAAGGGENPPITEEARTASAMATGTSKDFTTPLDPTVEKLLAQRGISPEQFDFNAKRIAFGDSSPLVGLGQKGAIYRQMLTNRAAQYFIDQGMDPRDALAAQAEFASLKAGARTLGNLDARTTAALQKAKQTAPIVLEASDKIDRTQYPSLNALYMAAQKGVGGENVVRLKIALETLASNFGSSLGMGNSVLTDFQTRRAQNMLEIGYSKGQMNAAVDQILKEIDREQAGVRNGANMFFRRGEGGTPNAPASSSATEGEPVPRTQKELKPGIVYKTSKGPAFWNQDTQRFTPVGP